jgi:GNAT superfamily N-acetyltransferase
VTLAIVNHLEGVQPQHLEGFFVGWPKGPSPQTHLDILQNATAVAIAWNEAADRVVGFANAISDGVLSAYIPLLEVLPDWQGQGLGKALIESLLGDLDDLYMIDIVCDESLTPFYEDLGFVALTGMARRNYIAQAGK